MAVIWFPFRFDQRLHGRVDKMAGLGGATAAGVNLPAAL